MNKKIKVLVIGPGLIGKVHIDLIMKNPRCELMGIVTPNKEKHMNLALELNVNLYGTIECAAKDGFDVVIVSSPTKYHMEHLSECLKHTDTVLVEKPVLLNSKEADCFREQNLDKVLGGHHRHSGNILNNIKTIMESDEIGEPIILSGTAVYYKPDYYFEEGPWRLKEGGGGIIDINLIHEIAIMQKLCGEIKMLSAITKSTRDNSDVEDSLVINIEFRNGCLGSFTMSDKAVGNTSWEHNSGESSAFPYTSNSCYRINFTNASLEFPNVKLIKYKKNMDWWLPTIEERINVEKVNPLEKQLDNLLDVFENKSSPNFNFKEGVSAVITNEAIKKSAMLKSFVELEGEGL